MASGERPSAAGSRSARARPRDFEIRSNFEVVMIHDRMRRGRGDVGRREHGERDFSSLLLTLFLRAQWEII